MSNRLAAVSTEDIYLIEKIIHWLLREELTTFQEAVVVGDVYTEGGGVSIHLGRASEHREGRHFGRLYEKARICTEIWRQLIGR